MNYIKKYLKYKKKYINLKNNIGGAWKGTMFQDRLTDVTSILKTKIKQNWDTSPFMDNIKKSDFKLDPLDVVLTKWNDEHTKKFLECITRPNSGVSGNQHIQNMNYNQILEMFVDLQLKIERENIFPLRWFDDGMLFIIEILYNKSPFRSEGCFEKK